LYVVQIVGNTSMLIIINNSVKTSYVPYLLLAVLGRYQWRSWCSIWWWASSMSEWRWTLQEVPLPPLQQLWGFPLREVCIMTDSHSQAILITDFIGWKIQIDWCNKNKLKDQYKIYLMCTVTWVMNVPHFNWLVGILLSVRWVLNVCNGIVILVCLSVQWWSIFNTCVGFYEGLNQKWKYVRETECNDMFCGM
jgi:hypothetical protein